MKLGITTRFNQNENCFAVNRPYLDFLAQFNLELIYLTENDPDLSDLLNQCDYLLLTGGNDIDSCFYNEPLSDKAENVRKSTDLFDFEIIRYAEKTKKPLFGICRGLQAINVYFKGSLLQDIENHREISNNHFINLNCGKNFLTEIFAESILNVNSYHHQAINRLAFDLTVCAKSNDDIIEAIEHKFLPIVATQWHIEKLNNQDSLKIFRYFLNLKK